MESAGGATGFDARLGHCMLPVSLEPITCSHEGPHSDPQNALPAVTQASNNGAVIMKEEAHLSPVQRSHTTDSSKCHLFLKDHARSIHRSDAPSRGPQSISLYAPRALLSSGTPVVPASSGNSRLQVVLKGPRQQNKLHFVL